MKLLVHFYQHLLLVLLGLMLFATEKAAAGITYGKEAGYKELSPDIIPDEKKAQKEAYARLTLPPKDTGTLPPDYTIRGIVASEKAAQNETYSRLTSADIIPGDHASIDSTATEKAAAGIAHGKLTITPRDTATGHASIDSTSPDIIPEEYVPSPWTFPTNPARRTHGKSKKSHKGGAN
eukprot:GHVS01050412.1.p1 GENE.GHVS01050412.1~~GHVS01050412.1.p1  ORF type:complete len:179 (+),score=24.70 GHVS01050412.1:238-774(+)